MIIKGSFPFLEEKGHVISLVGAGGKTTLMYAFAKSFSGRGFQTLVTTTTHIFMPDRKVLAGDAEEIRCLWSRGLYAVAGTPAEEGKMTGVPAKIFQEYMQMADTVLIEADGAKRMPCKVPAAHEPVIPDVCDIVVGVMGMDAIGRPLREVCFRAEEADRSFRVLPDVLLTPELAAEILSSGSGTRKHVGDRVYYVALNKCDSPERIRAGEEIRRLLAAKGISHCVLTAFSQEGTGGL